MTVSRLICELTGFLAEHGDAEVTLVQHENEGDYTYGDVRHIVDYENGTMGIVGEREVNA